MKHTNWKAVYLIFTAAAFVLLPSASFAQWERGAGKLITGGGKGLVRTTGTNILRGAGRGTQTGLMSGSGTRILQGGNYTAPKTGILQFRPNATANTGRTTTGVSHNTVTMPNSTIGNPNTTPKFDALEVPAANRPLIERTVTQAETAYTPDFEITEGGLPRRSASGRTLSYNASTPRDIVPVSEKGKSNDILEEDGQDILADLELYEALNGRAPTWDNDGTPLLKRTYDYLRAYPYSAEAQQIKNGVLSVNIRHRGARLLKNLERNTPRNRQEARNFIETFPDVPQAQLLRERLEVLESETGVAEKSSVPTASAGNGQKPPVEPTVDAAEMPERPGSNGFGPTYAIPAPNHVTPTNLSGSDMRVFASQQEQCLDKISNGNVKAKYYIGNGKYFNPLEQAILRAKAEGREELAEILSDPQFPTKAQMAHEGAFGEDIDVEIGLQGGYVHETGLLMTQGYYWSAEPLGEPVIPAKYHSEYYNWSIANYIK